MGLEPFRKSWRVLPDWVSAYLRNNTRLTLCLPKGHSALNYSHREWPTPGHQRSSDYPHGAATRAQSWRPQSISRSAPQLTPPQEAHNRHKLLQSSGRFRTPAGRPALAPLFANLLLSGSTLCEPAPLRQSRRPSGAVAGGQGGDVPGARARSARAVTQMVIQR